MRVTLYVEGGGDSNQLRVACRHAFRKLLEKAGFERRMPRLFACGGRNAAYDHFRTAHQNRSPDEYPIMLVDSEAPVKTGPWEHLKARDKWDRPQGAEDDQAQLMVACMETWIMADRQALRKVFRPELRENALFPPDGLEQREKDDVQQKLEDATRGCSRDRRYEKGKRSFDVVEALDPKVLSGDPGKVRLRYFKRFIDTLDTRL